MNFLYIAVILIGAPISTFFCVKFGRLGYLRANEFFAKQQTQNQRELDLRHR